MRGIGAVGVIIGHLYQNPAVTGWIYSFHMPLFFFISGYCYRKQTFSDNIKRKFLTIVTPYFFFGLLTLIYWYLIERRYREISMTFTEALTGLGLGQYTLLKFNSYLWFMPTLFTVSVLYNVLHNLGGKKLAYGISAVMSMIYTIMPLPELPWGFDNAFQYIGFFSLGNAMMSDMTVYHLGQGADLYNNDRKIKIVPNIFIATVLSVISFYLAYYEYVTGIMRFVTAFVGIALMIIIAIILEHHAYHVRYLSFLGRITLIVLCVHGPVYRMITQIISILLGLSTNAVRENFLLVTVITIITCGICAVIYAIMSRMAPWILGKKKV